MTKDRVRFLFLNLGHGYAHLFLLLYPTVVLVLEVELGRDYGDLLLPSTAGFVAFAACTLPAGWLGDRWNRTSMMALMFFGLGAGSILTSLSSTPWELAAGLAVIGAFAAIYHPVGIAMVVETDMPTGRALGINGVFGNMGVAAAPIAAAALSAALGWRAAFAVPGAVAILTGVAYVLFSRTQPAGSRAAKSAQRPTETVGVWRVVAFLVVANLLGGLTFHTTTISFPKVLDETLGAAAGPLGAGGLASLIFACAAFAQIGVGAALDRMPVRRIALVVIGLQVPIFLLLADATGWISVLLAFLVMLLVFGEIPINDILVARYSSAAWRARLYALKYILSLGVSAAAVPMVALLHQPDRGFGAMFVLLAVFMAVVAASALVLPVTRGTPAEARASA